MSRLTYARLSWLRIHATGVDLEVWAELDAVRVDLERANGERERLADMLNTRTSERDALLAAAIAQKNSGASVCLALDEAIRAAEGR